MDTLFKQRILEAVKRCKKCDNNLKGVHVWFDQDVFWFDCIKLKIKKHIKVEHNRCDELEQEKWVLYLLENSSITKYISDLCTQWGYNYHFELNDRVGLKRRKQRKIFHKGIIYTFIAEGVITLSQNMECKMKNIV